MSHTAIKKIQHAFSILFVGIVGWFALSGAGHFESDLSRSNPEFDLLDAYVFDGASKGNTAFVMTINPAADETSADTFGGNGLYNFHIATDDGLNNGMTFTVKFTGENIEITRLDTANGPLGASGDIVGSGLASETVSLEGGAKLWAGIVKDPFFGNAAGIQAFIPALGEGKFSPELYDGADDFFKPNEVGAIVLEVPNSVLGDSISYYASSTMQMGEKWVQINRAANVLVTHLFLMGDGENVAKMNATRAGENDDLRAAIAENISSTATLANSQDDANAYAEKAASMIIPDVLRYEVGTPANYGPNIRNGRALSNDGMNVVLSIFSGTAMDDKVDTSHHYQSEFPYVMPASE